MKLLIFCLMLVPVIVTATIDRLIKTYQPLYCPQTQSIQIKPVYFRSMYATPETEIAAISVVKIADGKDANLANAYGFEISATDVKHNGPISVAIRFPSITPPEDYEVPTLQVLSAVIECVALIVKEHKHTQLHIQVFYPLSESAVSRADGDEKTNYLSM